MEWLLIVLVYAGPWAKGDSVSMWTVPGWTTQAECQRAGRELDPLVKASTKELRFVCVARKG